jgi:hypothetical protein
MPPPSAPRRARPLRAAVIGLAAGAALAFWNARGATTSAPIHVSADAPVLVRYDVTAPAEGATARVTYRTGCGDTVTNSRVALPWSMELTVRPGAHTAVGAELDGEGEVTAAVSVNGTAVRADTAREASVTLVP